MGLLSDYDYLLPHDRIAQTPLEDRAASKLLWIEPFSGQIRHLAFRDCAGLLREGDLLVLNETRVTARRLLGRKTSGGAVEALLLREVGHGRYTALLKPGRRLKPGAEIEFEGGLRAKVAAMGDGFRDLQFEAQPDLRERIASFGAVPLPPYISARLDNEERYQTVYARSPGSAAAPTAGLHFTEELLDQLRGQGVRTATVQLDVSVDTFRPIEAEHVEHHRMHGEWCRVPEATVDAVRTCRGRVIAVGTTTVRTLETFATGRRQLESGERLSTLYIRPGFPFQVVDGLFTNFHMPRTSLLVMLAAFVGRDRLFAAYTEALETGYRFLSFGDSMLVLPEGMMGGGGDANEAPVSVSL